MDLDSPITLTGLTPVELRLLRAGILEWERAGERRPRPVDLIGFDGVGDLRRHIRPLADAIDAGGPLSRRDCRRVLLATELAFASETLGWARDWSADTDFTDRDSITVLRSIQEKLAGAIHGDVDHAVDTTAHEEPAWVPIGGESYAARWVPFAERFGFRAGTTSEAWPGIAEPHPSVTIDLGPIFRDTDHGRSAAGQRALNALGLLAMTTSFDIDVRLLVLDWQHANYHVWPHRLASQDYPQWPVDVFPDGDYHVFLTEDMTTGMFGHPWEQTLCVFGEPLVTTLVPLLTSWLSVRRRNG